MFSFWLLVKLLKAAECNDATAEWYQWARATASMYVARKTASMSFVDCVTCKGGTGLRACCQWCLCLGKWATGAVWFSRLYCMYMERFWFLQCVSTWPLHGETEFWTNSAAASRRSLCVLVETFRPRELQEPDLHCADEFNESHALILYSLSAHHLRWNYELLQGDLEDYRIMQDCRLRAVWLC